VSLENWPIKQKLEVLIIGVVVAVAVIFFVVGFMQMRTVFLGGGRVGEMEDGLGNKPA